MLILYIERMFVSSILTEDLTKIYQYQISLQE